jgi:UDP-GlcNAc:undecaprenyl-phosphate GlcNAc-1-phosphate transferase
MSTEISTFLLFAFFFFATMAFSLLINSILLRFVKTLGTKNQPGASVRWSSQTKPAIGGLSLFIIFFISFSVYSIAFDAREVFESGRIVGLLTAGTIGFLMGLTDDAYNTRPILKFLAQVMCGVILVSTGSQITFFNYAYLDTLLSVVWVVGIMNSINMLDNMDGIAASVSAFIIVAALMNLVLASNYTDVDFMVLLGVLAGLLGFLFFNWNPSSMYMGDTGSQFLGVVLAYVGIHYCWNVESLVDGGGSWLSIAALLVVFLLPITDTTVVTVNRLRKGQSPFVGGKDHTTHNLGYLGLTDKQVAFFYCIVSLMALAAYFFLLKWVSAANYVAIGLYIAGFLFLLAVFFILTEKNQKRSKYVK